MLFYTNMLLYLLPILSLFNSCWCASMFDRFCKNCVISNSCTCIEYDEITMRKNLIKCNANNSTEKLQMLPDLFHQNSIQCSTYNDESQEKLHLIIEDYNITAFNADFIGIIQSPSKLELKNVSNFMRLL